MCKWVSGGNRCWAEDNLVKLLWQKGSQSWVGSFPSQYQLSLVNRWGSILLHNMNGCVIYKSFSGNWTNWCTTRYHLNISTVSSEKKVVLLLNTIETTTETFIGCRNPDFLWHKWSLLICKSKNGRTFRKTQNLITIPWNSTKRNEQNIVKLYSPIQNIFGKILWSYKNLSVNFHLYCLLF